MFKVIVTYKDHVKMSVMQYNLKNAIAYKYTGDADVVNVQIFLKHHCPPDLPRLNNTGDIR